MLVYFVCLGVAVTHTCGNHAAMLGLGNPSTPTLSVVHQLHIWKALMVCETFSTQVQSPNAIN